MSGKIIKLASGYTARETEHKTQTPGRISMKYDVYHSSEDKPIGEAHFGTLNDGRTYGRGNVNIDNSKHYNAAKKIGEQMKEHLFPGEFGRGDVMDITKLPVKAQWETLTQKYQAKLHQKRLTAIYKDQLPGGVGDDKTPEDFDPEAVKKGAEDEMEHTYDPELATEIAIDHLTQDPNYYDKEFASDANESKAANKLPFKLDQKNSYKYWKGGF